MTVTVLSTVCFLAWVPQEPCVATIGSSATSALAGESFVAAVELKMDPGWHTYWRNPGDSGGATTIVWELPQGWRAGDIQWPVPKRIETGGLVSFGYEGSVVLLVPISMPADQPLDNELSLKAKVSWVVCKEECLMGSETLSLRMPVTKSKPGSDPIWTMRIAQARELTPQTDARFTTTARKSAEGYEVTVTSPEGWKVLPKDFEFFPLDGELFDSTGGERATLEGATLRFWLKPATYSSGEPKRVRGVLTDRKDGVLASKRRALVIDAPILTSVH